MLHDHVHCCFCQVTCIKQTDLLTAMQAMYHTLKRKVAFANYDDEMSFLALLGITTPAHKLPKNANLRSERLKAELIQVIGMFNYISFLSI